MNFIQIGMKETYVILPYKSSIIQKFSERELLQDKIILKLKNKIRILNYERHTHYNIQL